MSRLDAVHFFPFTLMIILLGILLSNDSKAQEYIQFHVIDSIEVTDIENAGVVLHYPDSGSLRTSFDLTDEKGKASVLIPRLRDNDSIQISVNHINYHHLDTVFLYRNLDNRVMIIPLIPKFHEITPIVIESTYLSEYDTIHIPVDSTEAVRFDRLTELLEKDNRFKLEDSYITFNNKPIRRILIDQMDITGSNYINFLYQLSASDFESMDVIQFYFENPLDQYFNRPDIALRLNTVKDGKVKKSLSLDASISQQRLNELRAQTYFFTPNYKGFLNVARHITQASTYNPSPFAHNEYNRELLQDRFEQAYSVNLFPPRDLPFEYYNNRKTIEMIYHSGFTIGKHGKNRLVYNPTGIRDQLIAYQGTLLYLQDSVFSYNSSAKNQVHQVKHRIENEYKYFKENTFINWLIKGSIPSENSSRSENYAGDIVEHKNERIALDRSYAFQSQFTWGQALSNKLQIQLTFDASLLDYDEEFQSDNQRNRLLFKTNEPILDELNSKLWTVDNAVGVKTRVGNHSLFFKLRHDYYRSNQQVYRTPQTSPNALLDFQESSVVQNGFGVQMNFDKIRGGGRFHFDAESMIKFSIYQMEIQEDLPHYGPEFLYRFMSSMNYEISQKYTMGLKLTWNKDWILPHRIRPVGYNDGSYLLFGGPVEKPIESQVGIEFNLSKESAYDHFSFQLKGNYVDYLSKESFGIQRGLLVGRRVLLFNPGKEGRWNGNFKYKIFEVPLQISLIQNYFQIRNSYILNESRYDHKFQIINHELELDSRWWSYGITGSFGYGLDIRKSISGHKFINRSWKGKLGLLYISQSEKIHAEVNFELSQYGQKHELFQGLGAKFDFFMVKNFNLGLYAINLFNQKDFEYRSDAEYAQYFTRYTLVPFQIGIRTHWDIW